MTDQSKPQKPKLRVISREDAKARALASQNPAPEPPNPAQEPNPKPRPSLLSSLRSSLRSSYSSLPSPIRRTCRVLRYVAPLVPIGMFFSEHVMQVVWVKGPSMSPYFNEGYEKTNTDSDMVLVSMWPWTSWPWQSRRRRLERGMVVTFRSPANPGHVAVKRIIGLPGDRITTREPCLKESQIVPFNHVWLEGDALDPKKSLDSNSYGPVSASLITGRAIAVLRPRFRWLNWAAWENGVFDGSESDQRPGEEYRKSVRDRVVKGAVTFERPVFE